MSIKQASVSPLAYNMFIDVVSVRNALPLGYNGIDIFTVVFV